MTFDFADIKPTIYNIGFITVAAIIGIVLVKYVLTRWPVQGLTEVIQSV